MLTAAVQSLEEAQPADPKVEAAKLPVSVIVAARNEARNLPRCLESLRDAAEIYVIDSYSTDGTVEIGRSFGAKVVQFHYRGGWPKKRQWGLDTLSFGCEWILLMDADEALTPELAAEIRHAIQDSRHDGYYIKLQMYFLGRLLRHGGASFQKLALFRGGKARFECRLPEQGTSMCDMEVHEHVLVAGKTGRLKNALLHCNSDSLTRYITKHDQYSNWEAQVLLGGDESIGELRPSLSGNQAQRRRWLKKKFFRIPGSPALLFAYRYLFCLGFLDGVPGLIYCGFQAVQMFHTKAKIYELGVLKG
jgi:glycosyltransferase involved in cell wall biosynthesis